MFEPGISIKCNVAQVLLYCHWFHIWWALPTCLRLDRHTGHNNQRQLMLHCSSWHILFCLSSVTCCLPIGQPVSLSTLSPFVHFLAYLYCFVLLLSYILGLLHSVKAKICSDSHSLLRIDKLCLWPKFVHQRICNMSPFALFYCFSFASTFF